MTYRPLPRNLHNTNTLYNHPTYQNLLCALERHERQRSYCRHDLAHFLDVARIATMMCSEATLEVSTDLIYTTALLHDIGRVEEHATGTPHHLAGVLLAKDLLVDLDFSDDEKATILGAIENHRLDTATGFSDTFRKADKASRPCFRCPSQETCHWPDDKKNLTISY